MGPLDEVVEVRFRFLEEEEGLEERESPAAEREDLSWASCEPLPIDVDIDLEEEFSKIWAGVDDNICQYVSQFSPSPFTI